MSERAEFHVMGQPFDGAPLHYTASGLNYVYLLNGFSIEEDSEYGRIITIKDERDLHRSIGLHVIMKARALTGVEFRFLRKLMGFKQKDLAHELGLNEQTVANYEKNKRIPVSSDRAMRTIFLLWITPDGARAEVIKRLNGVVKAHRAKASSSNARCSDIQTFTEHWQSPEASYSSVHHF